MKKIYRFTVYRFAKNKPAPPLMYTHERRRLSDGFERLVAWATSKKYVHIWATVADTSRSKFERLAGSQHSAAL